MRYLLFFIVFLNFSAVYSQSVTLVKGQLLDLISREPIENASIFIENGPSTVSDSLGNWQIEAKSGIVNIRIDHINYETNYLYEQRIRSAQDNNLYIELIPIENKIDEISIKSPAVHRSAENGNNIKTLEIDEIQRMPGAVMDISKVIKNFPGVSPRVSFGYNIIVRGGGSFENKFFLDGVEIPAITHFNVQGLSGGPNGAINTDLISRVTFKTGSFPVNRGNALSSTMDLEQKTGRRDRIGAKFTLGAAEYGAHIEGPLGKNSSFILSARKSYTEYLLKAFNLPVLPAFTDFQYKHQIWLPNKDQLTLIGFGTSDKYRLNIDGDKTDALNYNIGYIPEGEQSTLTVGANYKHFTKNGAYTAVISHSRLANFATKYYENSQIEADQSLDFKSIDNETKLRLENKIYNNKSTFEYGISYDLANFQMNQYSLNAYRIESIDTTNYESQISFQKYGLFASYNYNLNARWNFNIGIRADGNNFASQMSNPLSQFSPRASIQYNFSEKLSATIQSGIYYQLPPSVLLAYQQEGVLVNQNSMNYIESRQLSGGIDYRISETRRLNVDAFYKVYDKYPFLLRDSISFGNANGEYVTVGNQLAESSSIGQSYGIEFFFNQKLYKNWFTNVSATYVVSQFEDKNGKLVSSAWDNRVFLNYTIGKELRKNWTIGTKFTYAGSNPYTSYDVARSSDIQVWDTNRRGLFDFDRLNQERLPAFYAIDFRVDKKWYKKNMTIIAFLDLQNITNNKFQLVPYLTVVRDDAGQNIVSSEDPTKYETEIINSDTGRVLPTIGFSIEF